MKTPRISCIMALLWLACGSPGGTAGDPGLPEEVAPDLPVEEADTTPDMDPGLPEEIEVAGDAEADEGGGDLACDGPECLCKGDSCAAPPLVLCRPCLDDTECGDGPLGKGLCVAFDPGGSFCGAACLAPSDCPEGFDCLASGGGRDPGKQCRPAAGAPCPCPAEFVEKGYKTACFVENEHGKCVAERTCEKPCPAATPSAETCNGLDDDCDGLTDEEMAAEPCFSTSESGKCEGKTVCSGGKQSCDAPLATEEQCNGLDDDCDGATDEGTPDADGDGIADACDPDDDNDGVEDVEDNCPSTFNPDQDDNDGDGTGDPCDPDDDGDLVPDLSDNCPMTANPDQADIDGDGQGDACDWDTDGDLVKNGEDNCPVNPNPGQEDLDKDGIGDVCDTDDDGDGVDDPGDNCPKVANPSQADIDEDGLGDPCDGDKDGDGLVNGLDNCPATYNPDQADENGDGIGDACDTDWDGDGVANSDDNCPEIPNADQSNVDLDEAGDACDPDIDGDGLLNQDDNCPSTANPGQEDLDADGSGDACDPDIDGDKDPNVSDCDPQDKAVHHAAVEQCNGIDDNCDGSVDGPGSKGCMPFYRDLDKDGAGEGAAKCLCAGEAPYTAAYGGDCNDMDPTVGPKAQELCGNGVDDDCDGLKDEDGAAGCAIYFLDKDGDGFGSDQGGKCLCGPAGSYSVTVGGDCNDSDKAVNPSATEACNGKDDDCDGLADDPGSAACKTYYADKDGDGFGDPANTMCLCKAAAPYNSAKGGDCDDSDPAVHPGAAEVCNGKDDDCEGTTDVAAAGCKDWYADGDGDGHGVQGEVKCLCAAEAPFTAAVADDCDDAEPAIHPGAKEVCNGKDDDCNGIADDPGQTGCADWYSDVDGDGWGLTSDKQCQCAPDGKYVTTKGGDCNDSDPAVNPDSPETCNFKDDDCDGQIDEEGAGGCSDFFRDADADKYGLSGDGKCLCGASGAYTAGVGGDCDDTNAAVHPGVAEACNGLDDDCNGETDDGEPEGCVAWYNDSDGDLWGLASDSKCLCGPAAPYLTKLGGDCDDSAKSVFPGAQEACNQKNDDCDGETDEGAAAGCATYYWDADGDGFGVAAKSACLCAPLGKYQVKVAGDCNDVDPAINPAGVEACNGKDDDCNGKTDVEGSKGCLVFYLDQDNDGWGVSQTKCLCAAAPPYSATKTGDCNDLKAAIRPGAAETCNLVDDDCDGQIDEGLTCQCTYGQVTDCWSGPAGARFSNVPATDPAYFAESICKRGKSTCQGNGKWGACSGEVLPKTEPLTACTDHVDEDCDGDSPDVAAKDNDGDGWTLCEGDCCDFPFAPCPSPVLVNPGAFDAPNNGIDDDCDGQIDNGTVTCDSGLASNSANPLDYAKALDLCQFTVENPAAKKDKKWGVITAQLLLANGTGSPNANSRAIRTGFGTVIKPKKGVSLVLMSSGWAADVNDQNPSFHPFQGGYSMGTSSGFPADWYAANGNKLPNAPGCPGLFGTTANDPVMLKLRVRVPTNAKSFSFNSYFLSAEFPEWVCTAYNDFFVALLDSTYAGDPPNPKDKNLAFYDPPPAGAPVYPVGVNLAILNNGLFRVCKNNSIIGCLSSQAKTITTCDLGQAELAGTGLDPITNDCSSGQNTGGGTGYLKSSGNVKPGEVVELRIAVWDTSDHVWDSMVLVDNWEWSVEVTQPGTIVQP